VKDSQFNLDRIISAPYDENTYVFWLKGRSDCLIIDPGFQPGQILGLLDENQLVPVAILNTHGHSDHIAGNGVLKQRFPDCPLIIGHRDAAKLGDAKLNLSGVFGEGITSPPADRTVGDGDQIGTAGFDLEVREIPGHSAGHVIYVWKSGTPSLAFVGDVIFRGSVGRSDFYDGDWEQLMAGIRARIFDLPDDTVLLPGHGLATTVGVEKKTNPYVAM
jgi:hydroxyacylglutathione hydrolase